MLKVNNSFNNFKDFIDHYANKFKNNIYYGGLKNKEISYERLLTILKNFKIILDKYKILPQDKIMVICDNGEDLVLIFLSILYHKIIFVPVNPKTTLSEYTYLKKFTKPKLVITDKYNLKKLKIKKKYFLVEDYERIKNKNRVVEQQLGNSSNDNKKKEYISQILFTSGSTGKPKGVVLTHNSMIHNLIGLINTINFDRKNKNFLSITPLYHNNGQFIPTLLPFFIGGKTFSIPPGTSLVNFWPVCEKLKINYCSVMATHINFFNTLKPRKNHSLKNLFCGGAKLDERSQLKFEKNFNVRILCNYGLTETSSIACTESNIKNMSKCGSVGKPLINNQIKILKEKSQKYGEILIRGKNIFKEYLKEYKLTKNVKKNGWFHTGDLGYIDQKGFVYIKDRIDNMIIVSGENIYPSEIENLIYEFKKISLGVVTSIPDKITQNKLVLIYESKKILKKEEIVKFLSNKLTRFKVPQLIFSCEELGINEIPKAANKKILRKELKLIISKLFK